MEGRRGKRGEVGKKEGGEGRGVRWGGRGRGKRGEVGRKEGGEGRGVRWGGRRGEREEG